MSSFYCIGGDKGIRSAMPLSRHDQSIALVPLWLLSRRGKAKSLTRLSLNLPVRIPKCSYIHKKRRHKCLLFLVLVAIGLTRPNPR